MSPELVLSTVGAAALAFWKGILPILNKIADEYIERQKAYRMQIVNGITLREKNSHELHELRQAVEAIQERLTTMEDCHRKSLEVMRSWEPAKEDEQ